MSDTLSFGELYTKKIQELVDQIKNQKSYVIYLQKSLQYEGSKYKKDYEQAGFVECPSENMVFSMTQNICTHWNSDFPCRSTMVGDVFYCTTDNKWFRVEGIGLSEIEPLID